MKAIFLLIMQIWMAGAELYSEIFRIKLEGNFSQQGKKITHNGVIYPEGAHWSKGGETFGCPCQLKDHPCIPLCTKGEADSENLAVPGAEFELEVWDCESNKTVKLSEHFIPKENLNCTLDSIRLDQDIKHKILINGSIHVTYLIDEIAIEINHVYEPDEYCIMNNLSQVVIYVCGNGGAQHADDDDDDDSYLIIYLFIALMLVSVLFLLLTLVAIFFAPEMHNLHGISIACQSVSLMVAFATHAFARHKHIIAISDATCKILTYIAYFFYLNSFFWLNTMCFDIYWTFSGNRQISGASPAKMFLFYAIYTTTSSLALFVVMATMDNILDDTFLLWPGMGEERCWFRNRSAEFAFYQGPNLLMLISNATFFGLTIVKINNVKKETHAVLNSGDSKTHSSTKKDNQRFYLYGKLFLLMGGTWLFEIIISWFADEDGGPRDLWIITDSINLLRGVMIFYLCVWSNKKVRRSLLSRISDKCASCSQTQRSLISKATVQFKVPEHDENKHNEDDTVL